MELMFSWSALNSRKLITSRSPICASGVAGMSPKARSNLPRICRRPEPVHPGYLRPARPN